MQHFTVRAAAALATFAVGLAAVWLSGLGARLEAAAAEWLVPTSDVNAPAPALVGREGNEREVYGVVLREMFGGRSKDVLLVIRPETADCSSCRNAEVKGFDGAAAETLRDYDIKNRVQRRLPPLHGHVPRHTLLGGDKYAGMLNSHKVDGWKVFYERFPNSWGYISFSSVGFNRDCGEAFLYAEKSCGWLCGDGWYVLLKKGPGGWEIVRKEMIWVS